MTQPEVSFAAPEAATPEREKSLGRAWVEEVLALLRAERRGDFAELRRMDPEQPDAPAFFRMLARVAPHADVEAMRRYARFVQLLALRPEALNGDRLGAVMAASNVSESRAQRLLTARGPALQRQLVLLARRLANDGKLPWPGFAALMLTIDEGKAEDARLRIARDYWRALDRNEVQS